MIINPGDTRIVAVNGSTSSGVLNNARKNYEYTGLTVPLEMKSTGQTNEPGFSLI